MVALRLSKIWHVHPEQVLKTRIDLVIDAIQYESFLSTIEETTIMINRESNG